MPQLNLKALIARLNQTCRDSLEAAAGLTLSRTHYNVEVEHWLLKLAEAASADVATILRFYEVDVVQLREDLSRSIDRFKTGNSRPPALSPHTVSLAREAYLAASIEFGASRTRSGHLLYALLADETLSRIARDVSAEFAKIAPEALRRDLVDITTDTSESESAQEAPADGDTTIPGRAGAVGGPSKTPSLDQFTIDLTARARAGQIDPILGRDREIRQIIDILTRRRQNNPILTGEAGVGKTAVVEGFALRIAAGDVPEALKPVSLRSLDLGLLQAGAGVRGEFENRLKSVIDEVKSSPKPIIVFIDEAHTLIGAGGSAGQGDAANLLKPALARGELRTIAATTWAEYKKFFEKDAALERRFQVVKVEEPSEEAGIEMLRGLVSTLEEHHKVRVLDEAVCEAVRLSNRFISGRQLPDKAVGLLDTACARVAMSDAATPPPIEDARRRIDQVETEMRILRREAASGAAHDDRLEELQDTRERVASELSALESRWERERELVAQIRDIRGRLEHACGAAPATKRVAAAAGATAAAVTVPNGGSANGGAATAVADAEHNGGSSEGGDPDELRDCLQNLTAELGELQGDDPLAAVCVDAQAVAEVVSAWTGIPVGRMVGDEIRTVLNLKDRMANRIIGQDHALEVIARSIRTSRAGMADPRKPIGVFLFAGMSGVGKTETALALAELMYGSEQNMTVINMSEFKEEHKVSLLMGSPPGYVGYGEGGVLTEAVRRKPYSVLLLDEVEKAHPGVQDVFYQVFDKGMLRDGEGRDINFRNTVIVMTSNAGDSLIQSLCADPDTRPDPEALAEALHPELLKTFKPAFLGRIAIVPYYPLTDDVMRSIVSLQMGRVSKRVAATYGAQMTFDEGVVAHILERCREVQTGARNVEHILTRTLLPEMSAEFLARMADGVAIGAVHVKVGKEGAFAYDIS